MSLKALHKKNLIKAKKIIVDSVTNQLVSQVSSLKTLKEMFDSFTKLFEGKNINQNMALRKQLKNVKIQNAEQLEAVKEEVENAKVVIMASQDHGIHSFEECTPEGSDYFQKTPGRRRSSTYNKVREDGRNSRSSSHHPKKIPQAMRI